MQVQWIGPVKTLVLWIGSHRKNGPLANGPLANGPLANAPLALAPYLQQFNLSGYPTLATCLTCCLSTTANKSVCLQEGEIASQVPGGQELQNWDQDQNWDQNLQIVIHEPRNWHQGSPSVWTPMKLTLFSSAGFDTHLIILVFIRRFWHLWY